MSQFVTINQAAKLRPAFTANALRDMKFKAFDRKNSRGEIINGNGSGPAGVWIQVGTRVLLDLEAFDAWIESCRLVTVTYRKKKKSPGDELYDHCQGFINRNQILDDGGL